MNKLIIFLAIALSTIVFWLSLPKKISRIQDIHHTLKFVPHPKRYTFFCVKSVPFGIPVYGWSLDSLLIRSVLFLPHDIVRDGLPWFGALRDDWRPGRESRFHQGIDIYGDSLKVVAVQSGTVEKTGRDAFSGGIVKLDHGLYVKTVYIHLSRIVVEEGMRIDSGSCIGWILRPEGNARESQLHFELQVDGEKQDPLNYVKKTFPYAPEITRLLERFEEKKYTHRALRNRALPTVK